MGDVPAIDQHVTFIAVSDLDHSSRFYEENFGLTLALDQGACRIYRLVGESFLGLCQGDPSTSGVIITLVSDDVEAWHDRLFRHGVVIEDPPRENERFSIFHFFARDPDGYRIEVQRFLDPAWPRPGKV